MAQLVKPSTSVQRLAKRRRFDSQSVRKFVLVLSISLTSRSLIHGEWQNKESKVSNLLKKFWNRFYRLF